MVHLYGVFHKRISVADKEAVNSFAAVATIAFARIRSAIAPTEPDIGSLPEPNRVRQRARAFALRPQINWPRKKCRQPDQS